MEMPSATTTALATGAIVVGGMWANGSKLTVRLGIGLMGYAVGLAIMSEAQPTIAKQMSVLVFLGVLFTWGHVLAYEVGLTRITPVFRPSKQEN